MKVYVCWYDNCEEYEDNFQCIDGIFRTLEAAERFCFDKGYKRVEDTRRFFGRERYKTVSLFECIEEEREDGQLLSRDVNTIDVQEWVVEE